MKTVKKLRRNISAKACTKNVSNPSQTAFIMLSLHEKNQLILMAVCNKGADCHDQAWP